VGWIPNVNSSHVRSVELKWHLSMYAISKSCKVEIILTRLSKYMHNRRTIPTILNRTTFEQNTKQIDSFRGWCCVGNQNYFSDNNKTLTSPPNWATWADTHSLLQKFCFRVFWAWTLTNRYRRLRITGRMVSGNMTAAAVGPENLVRSDYVNIWRCK